MNNNYTLYLHECPNGKRYYGITKLKPKQRWCSNGNGYKGQYFYKEAIKKFGWNNIKHIIIYNDLSEDEAKQLEQYFIQWYDTTNKKYGYNRNTGGAGIKCKVINTTTGKVFDSIADATKSVNGKLSHMNKAINENTKYKGYRFKRIT